MSLFQIIAMSVMGLLLALTLIAMLRGRATRREGLPWSLVWIAAGAAIAWPDMTTRIARRLGIDRGSNLLLYCSVVVMLIGFLMIYARLRRMRRELTLIVRHLALKDAEVGRADHPSAAAFPGEPAAAQRDNAC